MRRRSPRLPLLALLLGTSLILACGDDDPVPGEGAPAQGEGPPAQDAGQSCQALGNTSQGLVTGNEKLDLLFVIDNSGSMAQEQAKLAEQIPGLLRSLTSGVAPDGSTFTAVRDLHVGVITTDMGLSGSKIELPPFCGGARGRRASQSKAFFGLGDDGLLVQDPGCSPGAGYLSYTAEPGDFTTVENQLACLSQVGTSGCGFEQQLEAMYKALAPSGMKTFANGTGGHGDGANSGFLRADAALAIVHLSDEEDCSVVPGEGEPLFDDDSNHPAVMLPGTSARLGLNIRCFYGDPNQRQTQVEAAGLIQPVDRYVAEFKQAIKPNSPESIVFIAIVGIPDGAEGLPLDEIINHPAMGFAIDPNTGGGDPSNRNAAARDVCRQCATKTAEECAAEPLTIDGAYNPEIITAAKPGVRFVRVAQGFGEHGVVQSICAPSLAPTMHNLVQKIARLPSAATPSATDGSPDESAGCTP